METTQWWRCATTELGQGQCIPLQIINRRRQRINRCRPPCFPSARRHAPPHGSLEAARCRSTPDFNRRLGDSASASSTAAWQHLARPAPERVGCRVSYLPRCSKCRKSSRRKIISERPRYSHYQGFLLPFTSDATPGAASGQQLACRRHGCCSSRQGGLSQRCSSACCKPGQCEQLSSAWQRVSASTSAVLACPRLTAFTQTSDAARATYRGQCIQGIGRRSTCAWLARLFCSQPCWQGWHQ